MNRLEKFLGQSIRELRQQKQMTISELSSKTRLDSATLSRMENGKMTGTLQAHMSIADALNVSLPFLLEKALDTSGQKLDQALLANDPISSEQDARQELLTGHLTKRKMTPTRLTINPKGKVTLEQLSIGSEKFIYVLEGKIQVSVGDKDQIISKGKGAYINASLHHYITNLASKNSTCLVIASS